jgi:hypothetical protein
MEFSFTFKTTALVAASCLPLLAAVPVMTADAATTTVLQLELNDRAGATVARDSSAGGHDGAIGSHVVMNGSFADWDRHSPAEGVYYGARHLVTIPDAADGSLDPGSGKFSVEIRFRTSDNFGNIIQKGQATTVGGQVKFQIPRGKLTCMFKTPTGTATAGSGTLLLNDNRWHTVLCKRTPTAVTMFVDGERVRRVNHATGTLDNKKPWTIGGKLNCDASAGSGADSCDYFAGDIDYVRMTKG